MRDSDLILSQIRQRLEILYQMVYELENEGGGGGGSSNYNELSNKPSINGTTLSGNKTSSALGLASASDVSTIQSQISSLTNELQDLFAVDNINLQEGDTFPSDSVSRLQYHYPVIVNNSLYTFLNETGIDYLYVSIPVDGALPSISYLRIMKDDKEVEFADTIIETVPTDDSFNLITSGGVYTALSGKVNTEDGKGLSTNDFTDAYKDGLIDIVDSGAKNRIKVNAIGTTTTSGSTYTNNGVTFTLNADGSITCTGDNDNTADSSVRLLFDSAYFNAAPYCNGEYVLSGSPADASDSTYFCSCYGSSYNYKDTGSGIVLPSTETASISVYITIKKGKSADGKTFYPMICRKEAYDVSKAYRPYVPSNQELYAMIQAL